MDTLTLGDITVHRIVESVCTGFLAREFFPETTMEDWARHGRWMEPWALEPGTGRLVLTIQAFLVRTRHHVILVDTCVGDHKSRPSRPFWDMQRLDTFLPKLAALGVAPEAVDYVMCTHLHADHVGWNTRLQDGRWVPAFPKATYIFSEKEWRSFEAMHREHPLPQIEDSVLPVIAAGLARLVPDDFALDDEVRIEPTPGHTPGHLCIRLTSKGRRAVVTGDCIHSPVQCREPQWIMRADSDRVLACATRQRFLEQSCDDGSLVCATHFPEPSFGLVVREGHAFRFEFAGQPGRMGTWAR